jgi:hypothetical protein
MNNTTGASKTSPTANTSGKSVVIMSGNKWALRVKDQRAQMMVGPETVKQILSTVQMKSPLADASGPRTKEQERGQIISLLGLDEKTISRIDANARVLGLSFAQAISAELTQ